jgi:hypothetical protein
MFELQRPEDEFFVNLVQRLPRDRFDDGRYECVVGIRVSRSWSGGRKILRHEVGRQLVGQWQ